jgi:hypothetical protein
VENPLAVREIYRTRDLRKVGNDKGWSEPSIARDESVETFALYKIHDDVGKIPLDADLKDRNDVGVPKDSGGARFVPEPLERRISSVQLNVLFGHPSHRFDRDRATDLRINGLVNQSHGTPSKRTEHLVLANDLWNRATSHL